MTEDQETPKNADIPVSYVTQGKVQIERRTGTEAKIFINPTPDYAVKHNGEDYIVFAGPVCAKSLQGEARLFDKRKGFPIKGDFIEVLTQAAFQGTKIEIQMNADSAEIEALSIPATP